MDILKEKCPFELLNLYLQFIEEIEDFFYKYDLFAIDNVYSKIFECLKAKDYMSYSEISEIAAINTKSVIKIIQKYEIFFMKILEFSKYKALKDFVTSIK